MKKSVGIKFLFVLYSFTTTVIAMEPPAPAKGKQQPAKGKDKKELKVPKFSPSVGSKEKDLINYSAKGELGKVKSLLQKGKVNLEAQSTNGGTALHWAAYYGHVQVVEALLAAQASIDVASNDGMTPLHWAAGRGQNEVVIALVRHRANVNARKEDFATPLHYAADGGHEAVVKTLLAAGAEKEVRTKEAGATALHFAVGYGHEAVVRLLLDAGVKLDVADKHGYTPLHEAALTGRANIVRMLLARQADVNATSQDGSTPLHCAVSKGSTDVVKLLLAGGADDTAAKNDGKTAGDIAVEKKFGAIVLVLVRAQANRAESGEGSGTLPTEDESVQFLEDGRYVLTRGTHKTVVTPSRDRRKASKPKPAAAAGAQATEHSEGEAQRDVLPSTLLESSPQGHARDVVPSVALEEDQRDPQRGVLPSVLVEEDRSRVLPSVILDHLGADRSSRGVMPSTVIESSSGATNASSTLPVMRDARARNSGVMPSRPTTMEVGESSGTVGSSESSSHYSSQAPQQTRLYASYETPLAGATTSLRAERPTSGSSPAQPIGRSGALPSSTPLPQPPQRTSPQRVIQVDQSGRFGVLPSRSTPPPHAELPQPPGQRTSAQPFPPADQGAWGVLPSRSTPLPQQPGQRTSGLLGERPQLPTSSLSQAPGDASIARVAQQNPESIGRRGGSGVLGSVQIPLPQVGRRTASSDNPGKGGSGQNNP